MLAEKLKNLQVLFITHSYATGFSQMFYNFSKEKVKTFIFIDHPLQPKLGTKTVISCYSNGKLIKQFCIPRIGKISILNYLLDTVISIFFGIFLIEKKADLSIGADNLNTFALIILKKLDKVKKVIYHTVDYTPHRFKNSFLNKSYHIVDRFCCYSADMLWNSSSRMNEGRIKEGLLKDKIAHTIITPDGSNFDINKRLPISKIDKKKLVFLGHMRFAMGIDLVINSFKEIIKIVPDSKLLLIGGGPNLEEYKKLAQDLGLNNKVEFTGYIENHKDVDDLLKNCSIGIAAFEPNKNSYEYYSDVGKPKVYLAAGLPVVITRVPEIADVIEKEKAGIVIGYEKKELIDAVVFLLQHKEQYCLYRTNAIRLSKKYIWSNIFIDAYRKTLDFFEKEKM